MFFIELVHLYIEQELSDLDTEVLIMVLNTSIFLIQIYFVLKF